MKLHKTFLASLIIATLTLPVSAMTLNQAMTALPQAKAQGTVGEQANGYLGVVKNQGSAAEIASLINNARKQEYQKVASKNGATLTDVEKLAGSKAQEKTPSGQYIQVNGQWKQK